MNEDDRPVAVVIEDDPDIAHLLRIHLAALGFGVRAFETGEDGLAAVRAELPAIVLLDLGLPGMGGWDVLDRLRDDDRTNAVPVVLTSVADLTGALARKASAVLQKPFLRADVRRAVAPYLLT
jgi:DNA-binding response OmpR family regulator